MRQLSYSLFALACFGLMQTPAFGQTKKEEFKPPMPPMKMEVPKGAPKVLVCPAPSFKHLDGQLLVFVANGAGGSSTCSDNLLEVSSDLHLGLRIQTFPWCRTLSIFEDLRDDEAQIKAAAKMACSVMAIRKDAPNAHIFLVGHSAGARVALAAAEMLPPKSVDRVMLIAAAVPACYDLTGALKTSRCGIENFWSSEDGVLDSSNEHGLRVPAAGKIGFRLPCNDKETLAAYRAVRQYRWNVDLAGSGGHFAWTRVHNMKKVIVPMFFTAPVSEVPPPILERLPPPKK